MEEEVKKVPQENNIPCDLELAPGSSQKVEVPQTSRPSSSSSSSSLSHRPSPSTSEGLNLAEAEIVCKLPTSSSSSSSSVNQQSLKSSKDPGTFESPTHESRTSFPSVQSEVKSADFPSVSETKKGVISVPGQQQQSERTDWTSPSSSTPPTLLRTTSRDGGESTSKGRSGQNPTLDPLGQDFLYLLPDTSGFPDSNTGLPGIKRGRGRPKKDGTPSTLRKPRARGISRGLGRSFGSRGLSVARTVGRSLGRGSRGGRRGRPPFPHAGLPMISSLHSKPKEDTFSLEGIPQQSNVDKAAGLSAKLSSYVASGMADLPQSCASSSVVLDRPSSASPSQNGGSTLSEGSLTVVDNSGPTHLCSLCNCGERSLLGQGEMWHFVPTPGFDVFKMPEPKSLRASEEINTVDQAKGPQPTTWRRARGPMKSGRERSRSPRQYQGEEDQSSCQINDELSMIGIHEDAEISQLYEPTGHLWVHYCCALWSHGVTVGETQQLEDVDKAVYNAMSQRCSYCKRFGATLMCIVPDCEKKFHFPCSSAGGCFQDMKTLSLLCPEHIDQAETLLNESTACIQCGLVGDLKGLLFCSSCGYHYHGNCLTPPVDFKPIVRAGWQCPNCKICQTCRNQYPLLVRTHFTEARTRQRKPRTASDENKMLVCDTCDKGYHIFCLKPAMTTIPKNGWKCKNCRICTDCGSRTPGSGPSSRWHLNYSVCDSCYQQRNKGLCCPLCGKAYRHFHNKAMLPCMICTKFVHIECDPSISGSNWSKVKDAMAKDYVCTVCRETDPDSLVDINQHFPSAMSEESMESIMTDETVAKEGHVTPEIPVSGLPTSMPGSVTGGLTASSSQESLFACDDSSSSYDFDVSEKGMLSPSSRRDSFDMNKRNRQKSRHFSSERHRRHHHHHHHQHSHLSQQPFESLQQPTLGEKRRGPKIKVKIGGQVMGITSVEHSSPVSQNSSQPFSACSPIHSTTPPADSQFEEKEREKDKKEEEDDDEGDDHPATLILAESSDLFIMDQDICKACGSFGKDDESKMIVCTQCGQCYHPYCVSVKVTKVMLQKGWRCLDCTACEGCGGPSDEGRLLLCDDCDISYHTYCLDPPLETVPKGNWKCKWCVMCVNCGSTSPGFACQWMNNYTQCGPCHSKMFCPVCLDSYLIDQLIIQCQQCDRWLHCECDGLTCEDEAEIAADYGYHCYFCRPRTNKYGPLPPPPPPPSPPKEERIPTPPPALYVPPIPEPPRQFFVDGVYLYASGLSQIQKLQVTNPKKVKATHRRSFQSEDSEEIPDALEPAQEEIGQDGVKKRKPRRVFGLGIGGFIVRQRSRHWIAKRQASVEEQEGEDKTAGDQGGEKTDKPKRRRKVKKSKMEEQFPFYMQEAFFGKSILDQTKETTKGLLKTESDSDAERSMPGSPAKPLPAQGKDLPLVMSLPSGSDLEAGGVLPGSGPGSVSRQHTLSGSEQSEDIHSLDESDLKDILRDFHEGDDIFSLIHEELKDDGLSLDGMEAVAGKSNSRPKSSELPDQLEQMLTSDMDKGLDVEHMISEGLVHFDSKTVDDIVQGVLSNQPPGQPSEGNQPNNEFGLPIPGGMHGSSQGSLPHPQGQPMGPGPVPDNNVMTSPRMEGQPAVQHPQGSQGLPPFGMPFNPAYSSQMGPGFQPGMAQNQPGGMGQAAPGGPSANVPPWNMMEEESGDGNEKKILKLVQEEEMGDQATISCVLYVNMCHTDLKQKYPDLQKRYKQIAKLWRKLSPDEKAPFLAKARKNRTSSRVQKAQKKRAVPKVKNQVSQELQRRQEAQKRQDSVAMPPPPAPPPLPPGEHYHEGNSPMMSPHPGSSPSPFRWQDDGSYVKATVPMGPEGAQTEQVYSPQQSAGSVTSPDPYAFPSSGASNPFSPTSRPGGRTPLRLPSLQTFGASSPQEEDNSMFSGMGPRVRTGSDPFSQNPEMMMVGSRRPSGPRMGMPPPSPQQPQTQQPQTPTMTETTANPLGDSGQTRPSPSMPPADPYAFPPGTPQAHTPEDPFVSSPDHFMAQRPRGDMFPGAAGQMRPPGPPTSMPGSPYPGSPVRPPDPGFRHPLARSNSMPDPYSMQMGTPRPPMDPSMSRSMSEVGQESMHIYRGRMPLQPGESHQGAVHLGPQRNKLLPSSPWATFPFMPAFPDGGDGQPGGSIPHHQLRVILGQQTKLRMAKKQEEAERMMQGPPPPVGWPGPEGSEGMEGYTPRLPFRGPAPRGPFMRQPHPGMGHPGTRPPFYPGSMPRPPHGGDQYGPPGQEGMIADQRTQYMQMMPERMNQASSQPSTPTGSIPTSQPMGNLGPFMAQSSEGEVLQATIPPAGQPQKQPGQPDAGNVPSKAAQPGSEEILSEAKPGGTETVAASTTEESSVTESEALLSGMDEKAAKPSISSEDDKNEEDDLLSLFPHSGADGTFDILKYADPDLDLDLDDKMFDHLDFMEDEKAASQGGDTKKDEDEKDKNLDNKEDGLKQEKDAEAGSSKATDFQAQFLEFNQRQQMETKKEKGKEEGKAETKGDDKTDVGQIAALLQGSEALAGRLVGGEDVKPQGEMVPNMAGSVGMTRTPFTPTMQMSPSQGPAQSGSSGLPSPKIMQSPRSGIPSPRTPNMQSPFNTMLGGRHSASPHSQPMTPGGSQMSPFSTGNVPVSFSPPTSSNNQQFAPVPGTGSAPHSPYPISSQPPFPSMSSPHMMSPGYPASSMGPRAPPPPGPFSSQGPQSYNQPISHAGGPRPVYGIRPPDAQSGRFPRPGDAAMEGLEGMGPRMPQPMAIGPDGRPHPMYQQMQARGMRGPPPNHPGLQQQLNQSQTRPGFPPQIPPPPHLSHPGNVRAVGPHPPFPGGPPTPGGPQTPTLGGPREQRTLLDDLLEKEKEEQQRQAEQQVIMHRRDSMGMAEQGMQPPTPTSSVGPAPPMPPASMGPRMEHPRMRMPTPDGSAGPGVWVQGGEGVRPHGAPNQFQQGFPPRMMHPGIGQRPAVPFSGPPEAMGQGPGPSGAQQPGGPIPMGPPTAVKPPSGEMGPEYDRQAAMYEDWLNKQALYLDSRVKSFETQVNKLKRAKKTIQARQRVAKKNCQELNPADTAELERISTEQSGLQKQLEAQRKQLRQHQHLMQDYRSKQPDQYNRMWSGEAPVPGPSMGVPPPRNPGGQNSVRLSPTARQEYDAYMQNRIRMATQQQQQQNRIRPPTTILGDNNPFSEAFQQRENIQRHPLPPGSVGGHPMSSGTGPLPPAPAGPPGPPVPPGPPSNLPGAESPQIRPQMSLPTPEATTISTPTATTPTTTSPPTTVAPTAAVATPVVTTSGLIPDSPAASTSISQPASHQGGPPPPPPPPPPPGGPPTSGPLSGPHPGHPRMPSAPGPPGSRGPESGSEGMPPIQFFRDRNIPFEAGAGPRFPRPPGPGNFPERMAGPGQGPTPRLPAYAGPHNVFPQAVGSPMDAPPRMPPFQQGIPPFQQGPIPSDGAPPTQPPAKEKKKRKKKKKGEDLEGAQSQPLPPSLPNQAMLGQLGNPSSSTITSSNNAPVAVTKPSELPRPQSETERRILEILNNSQKELQNPTSPSAARGGKSPRSRSPARAQSQVAASASGTVADIQQTGTSGVASMPGNSVTGVMAGESSSSSSSLHPGQVPLGFSPTAMSASPGIQQTLESPKADSNLPSASQQHQVPPPPQTQQQASNLHQSPQQPHPPNLPPQQHMLRLQNLAQMQQFQQQFGAMPEGSQRPPIDPQQMPLGGPRYPQLHPFSQRQRFPPGMAPSFHVRPPLVRGQPPFPPHIQARMSTDPHLQSPDTVRMASHQMLAQRMPVPLSPGGMAPHLVPRSQVPPHSPSIVPGQPPPSYMGPASTAGLTSVPNTPQHISREMPLSTINQHPLPATSGPLPPMSGVIPSLQKTQPQLPLMSSSSSSSSPSLSSETQSQAAISIPSEATSSAASNSSSSAPSTILSTTASSHSQALPAPTSATSSYLPQSGPTSSSCPNIPAQTRDQIATSGAQSLSSAASTSVPSSISSEGGGKDTQDSNTTKKTKGGCDDGLHCGTDDEDEKSGQGKSKTVCEDGIHCGTDDEEEQASTRKTKSVCDDGIHCGTDDEEEQANTRKTKTVCDDGIHCGTDDEEEQAITSKTKTVCEDGIHCGTDDEEEQASTRKTKTACDDGIHCGTDDEEEQASTRKTKTVCDDGIHCGTDDEEEESSTRKTKTVCDDGMHCGTDDEEEESSTRKTKTVCEDGMHCGTDEEEEESSTRKTKTVCDDGIHCGTDDEEEEANTRKTKRVCEDGIHCGTDDEEEQASTRKTKSVCDDGIHCGTDDEEEKADTSKAKTVCEDGIHCGTDDEEEQASMKKTKSVCDDGIHCGTDDEEEQASISKTKSVYEDGIHCGTDDEEEEASTRKSNTVCDDGIHCGTDDEEEQANTRKTKIVCEDGIHCGTDDEEEQGGTRKTKSLCEDGIHCGTDDEEEQASTRKTKIVCEDGIHCGTDDEEEQASITKTKTVCDDGIHCGTDDEEERASTSKTKSVCDDGMHCGTDDEEEQASTRKTKSVCEDGIHCGTDDEEEQASTRKTKSVCDDGMHCGTDDEEEQASTRKTKIVCEDGIHCGTDDEEEPASTRKTKIVCEDGVHCGTDDEEEQASTRKSKSICEDGIHCGTDDEEEPTKKVKTKTVCEDGIHCGTDDEEEQATIKKKQKACGDGMNCGTDDEEEKSSSVKITTSDKCQTSDEKLQSQVKKQKKACEDGIHCGTDDEEEGEDKSKKPSLDENAMSHSTQLHSSSTSPTEPSDPSASHAVVKVSTSNSTYTNSIDAAAIADIDVASIPLPPSPSTSKPSNSSTPKKSKGTSSNSKDVAAHPISSSSAPLTTFQLATPATASMPSAIYSQISSVSQSLANFASQINPDGTKRPSDTLSAMAFQTPAPSASPATSPTTTLTVTSSASSTFNAFKQNGSPSMDSHPNESKSKQESEKEVNRSSSSPPQSQAQQLPAFLPKSPSQASSANQRSPVEAVGKKQEAAETKTIEQQPTGDMTCQRVVSPPDSGTLTSQAPSVTAVSSTATTTNSVTSSSVSFPPASSSSQTLQPEQAQQSFTSTSLVSSASSAVTSSSSLPIITSGAVSSAPSSKPLPGVSSIVASSMSSSMSTPTPLPSSPSTSVPSPTAISTSSSTTSSTSAGAVAESPTTLKISLPPLSSTLVSTSIPSSAPASYGASSSFAEPTSRSESRPVIPPLRIRMDGQSQPQVYESNIPSGRDHHRSETSVQSRSKGEGDLKLVLRKVSDGTAELISGPFKEKVKRPSNTDSDLSSNVQQPPPASMSTGPPPLQAIATASAPPPSQAQYQITTESSSSSSVTLHSSSPQASAAVTTTSDTNCTVRAPSTFSSAPSSTRSLPPLSAALSSLSTPMATTTTPVSTPSASTTSFAQKQVKPSTYSTASTASAAATSQPSPVTSADTSRTHTAFCKKPEHFKNVSYEKSADTDVVKISVEASLKTSGETKKVIRSYTTDIEALERLQSTIDAVAAGESTFQPQIDSSPPPPVDKSRTPTPSSVSNSSEVDTPSSFSSQYFSPSSELPSHQQQMHQHQHHQHHPQPPTSLHHQHPPATQQQHPQHMRMTSQMSRQPQPPPLQHPPSQPMPPQQQQPMADGSNPYMTQQPSYPHPPYRMTRPPLDLLAQASQSALSSAGTAMPSQPHVTQDQQQRQQSYMTDRSPSASSEHSPLHQPYPGMMGPRPMGSSPGISSKPPPGQSTQAYMQGQPQQPYGPTTPRFNPRMHHDMQGTPAGPYGMPPHPMSPTGSTMHRQRPPLFPMGGDMSRMPRPQRGMPMRPMPPEMMGAEQGMRPRMPPHQFMSPSHPGMGEMTPTSHGIPMSSHAMPQSPHAMQTSPHCMQTSPHSMQTSPHGIPTSPHSMQRPPMMSPHHPMMPGVGTPTSVSGGGGGGPLASLANFHPPGHQQSISSSMASPTPMPPHHQRPPMFPQMMGEARMATRLRMMASSGEGGPMMPHYRHMMMMRGSQQAPHPSQIPSQQMSPHMSPQMSPGIQQTQPLRHLEDDKSFINNMPVSGGMPMPGMVDDGSGPPLGMMSGTMGGKPRPVRPPFLPGMMPGDPNMMMSSMTPHHPPSESGSVISTPSMTSPMSDSAGGSIIKLEPSEDSASVDGSTNRDELDLDQKAKHNELLKQLLGTSQGGRQLPTPDSEDSMPSLTPEQQKQLEMIDSMPLCKETEISTPEWESKTPEEKEKILEMRRQEYENKRLEYEVSRKNKRKNIGGPGSGVPLEKKKRKQKAGTTAGTPGEVAGVEGAKKKSKKTKIKENQMKELEAQAETFLQQLHNLPPISLREPVVATSLCILPVKGASSLTGLSDLKGRFCSAYIDGIQDMYGSLLFPQPPPGLRATVPSAQELAQRQAADGSKVRIVQPGGDSLQMVSMKEGMPGLRTSPKLVLPPQPRIEIKSEQMIRDRKEERETPDTVVSSSSPEFGYNEQEPEYPGLRPIDPATSNLGAEEHTSPVMPLVHPLPVKPASQAPAVAGAALSLPSGELNGVKQESGLVVTTKQESCGLEAGPSNEQPSSDLTVNLPNLTSGLAQPFLDPALDQQVSVTLTLSTGAAQDIGAVISAIADLLKIAVPPTYEITRSPSPEMFRMSLTHKEEAVNIHTLMSTRPRFCQHCDVFVLCSGIAKFKREFPFLLEQDPDCGNEEMIFCSMNCSMQFSASLEVRQRQAQMKDRNSPVAVAETKPLTPQIKSEASPTRVSANMDEIIAAVAADTSSFSPSHPNSPSNISGSPGTPSTTPTSPLPSTSPAAIKAGKRHRRSSSQISEPAYLKPVTKKWRGLRWKRGNQELLDTVTKMPPITRIELDSLWHTIGMVHRPSASVIDKRKCVFCQQAGDGESDGPSRLLNIDVNKWVHLNCALWSYDVYETLNGALMNVDVAWKRSLSSICVECRRPGATLPCFKQRCANIYHLTCAKSRGCMFYQDKTFLCPNHIPKIPLENELSNLVVLRRVYINRDEDKQVASMIHQEEGHNSLRIGSLILHSIGQLLPHQIQCGKFHSREYIYPVGFKTSRFYWSFRAVYKRCRYVCSIHDNQGLPEFQIKVVETGEDDVNFKDSTPAGVWLNILAPLEKMRREADLVKVFPSLMGPEDLFGLSEPNIVKVLESLPGSDLLQNYNFKYGRSPLIEMPPAINPTGCARTEPKLRTHFRRPHTLQSTNSRSLPSTVTGVSGDMNSPYHKQFVHSKTQQYRRLKIEWKSLVYLGRSRIQGLGLYAAKDLEKHTMVIEYIGDSIRNEVANRREKEYESQNRGVYMFRIDNDMVIDATMAGGPARYINHSCNPNCVAEVVDIEKESKIIIITSRKIVKGEELTYDYKFDFEDDQHKIPCNCGATNCRKWMN